jgi:hypothetical protein
MQFQFLEGPPPGGFSFCQVIGFPSNISKHKNGRTPESDGPLEKCVGRIGPQQARHGERCVARQPPVRRIRREVLGRLEAHVYAISVDKSGLLVWARRKAAKFRPYKTAAKNSCVRFRILQEWDSHIAALAVSVSRRPASAGFLF